MVGALLRVCRMPGRSPPSLPTARDRVQARCPGRPTCEAPCLPHGTPAKKGDTCPAVRRGRRRTLVRLTGRSREPVAISFGHDRPWGGVSQREYQRKAQDPLHPLAYRVHFAAIGWADRHGHAAFAPGKLATLLGKTANPCLTRARTTRSHAPRGSTLYRPGREPLALFLVLTSSRRGRALRCRAASIKTGEQHTVRVASTRQACTGIASGLRKRSLPLSSSCPHLRPRRGPTEGSLVRSTASAVGAR